MPVLDHFRLDNKVALVTGASAGIGASIAQALAEAGATVACHGNSRPAETTAASIGGNAAAFQADLSSTEGAQQLFDQVIAKFSQIDILVNNAGTIIRHEAVDYPFEDWQRVIQINLNSVFQLSQLVGRALIERKAPGKIVNIASLLSFQGGIRVPAYAASKGAVAQLTKALANEWAPRGIQVNAIAPGYIATDNTLPLRNDETRNRQILERIPTGRWGDPEDIAATAVFLSSPAANYITGTVLNVDGGWLAR
ncbi:2-dehydro-3-deoxy-D-gluconate 5-dehydrogenase KduD [Terriglobus sp. 2YAB30_2]|uniref:2-dehydro-3-deoxy-D-gluconate 5-dehydrogenase KduD n=1 Tax=Terriglobus sp. 2YAB30_2 TaxID=3233023 RepID=UPI003F96A83E